MPLDKDRTSANVRERERTKNLNMAYEQLKSLIPSEPSDKMTKKMILKLAQTYIDFLSNLLNQHDSSGQQLPLLPTSKTTTAAHKSSPANSACSSTRSYAAHLSAFDEEEDEADCQEKRSFKRRRLEANRDYKIQPTTNIDTSTCYSDATRQQSPLIASSHLYAPYSPPPTSDTSSIYVDEHHHLIQNEQDDLRVQLRDAFRRYRSGKRKSR